MNNKSLVVAVDGYASSGKSTLAKDIARELSIAYVDTGAMYRAVTHYFQEYGVDIFDSSAIETALSNINIKFKPSRESGKSETYLNGNVVEKKIRELKVSSQVSEVSALRLVRDFLVAQQRQMGYNTDMVMDGRDIGTIVFPEARVKFFVFANLEIRAQRRYNELNAKGSLASYNEVLSNLEHRDLIDTTRKIAPLKKAEDAFQIDNSKIGVSEQLKLALDYINDILKT